jgi:hypothetical protein
MGNLSDVNYFDISNRRYIGSKNKFSVQHTQISKDLQTAVDDSLEFKNLQGPFKSASEAIDSMLSD